MLGVRQLVVLVDKMDLVGFDRAAFARVVEEYESFLQRLGVRPERFIPLAARDGENVAQRSTQMPWYSGPTVLEALDHLYSVDLMLDAGVILGVTADGLTQDDLDLIKTTVDPDRIETVWLGEEVSELPGLGHRGPIAALEARALTTDTEWMAFLPAPA